MYNLKYEYDKLIKSVNCDCKYSNLDYDQRSRDKIMKNVQYTENTNLDILPLLILQFYDLPNNYNLS